MKKIALFVFAAFLMTLGSCATMRMDSVLLSDESIRETLPPLSVDLGYDVFMLRVDLRRGTHETIEIDKGGMDKTVVTKNEYDPLVFDLGGGIILDRNENLCLDLVRLYGLDSEHEYSIVYQGVGFGAPATTITRTGGVYRIERKGGYPAREEGRISETEAVEEKGRYEIKIRESDIIITKRGLLGIQTNAVLRKKASDQVSIPMLIGEKTFTLMNGNSLRVAPGFTIVHEGTRIGMGNYTLIRSGGNVYFFDKRYSGFELRRDGSTVQHFVNGRLVGKYTLTMPE